MKKFVIVLILLVVGLFFWFRKDISGSRLVEGQNRINLILDINPLVLLSLDTESNKGIAVVIPNETYMEVPYGYGPYKAGSIYPLGDLDPKKGGGYLLSQTIQDVFGLPVGNYIANSGKMSVKLDTNENFITFKKHFFALSNLWAIRNQFKSNLTLPELVRLWLIAKNLRDDQINFFNLNKYNILKNINLADGSSVSLIDPDKLDKTLEGEFNEQDILKENISISVLNGTSLAGVGAKVTRIIGNIGGKVVTVGNSDEKKTSACVISGNSNLFNSYTVIRLKTIFKCNFQSGMKANSQSDLIISLGEDFIK